MKDGMMTVSIAEYLIKMFTVTINCLPMFKPHYLHQHSSQTEFSKRKHQSAAASF